jgi:CrcB protein
MADLGKLAMIFVGGGAGSLMRYGVDGWVHGWWGPAFPLGTMIVNVSGCLAIGFLVTLWTGPVIVRDDVRSAVLIGLLGGYTTFSTFGRETWALLHDGEWWRAGVYIAGTVILSLAAVWAGSALAGRLYGSGAP